MHLLRTILLATICLLTPFAQAAFAEVKISDETKAQIERQLDEAATEYGIAGQSLAVLKNGALVYTSARGLSSVELDVPATEETVYQGFSLAKLFVNVTMMQLVETGSIELDMPVSHYLTDLPEAWEQTTVRQALSHMTGLPDYYNWPAPTPETPQEAIASVADKALEFETGSTTQYNQTNYLLLKMIIEKKTGEAFVSGMTARMIDGLGLKNTSYGGEYAVVPGRATTYRSADDELARNVHIDQPDYMFASTGLNTTVLDLADWFSALLDYRFLSEETMEAMWSPVLLNNGTAANFANGWEFSQDGNTRIVGHGGGNRTDLRHYFEPGSDESITVIYFTNGSQKNFWPGSVSGDIAKIVGRN